MAFLGRLQPAGIVVASLLLALTYLAAFVDRTTMSLLVTPIKVQLGAVQNGLVIHESFVPSPKLNFPGLDDLMKRYQAKAADLGLTQVDVMKNLVAALNSSIAFNKKNFWIDPAKQVGKVNGTYRSSWITDPPNGKVPYTPAGRMAMMKPVATWVIML